MNAGGQLRERLEVNSRILFLGVDFSQVSCRTGNTISLFQTDFQAKEWQGCESGERVEYHIRGGVDKMRRKKILQKN